MILQDKSSFTVHAPGDYLLNIILTNEIPSSLLLYQDQ